MLDHRKFKPLILSMPGFTLPNITNFIEPFSRNGIRNTDVLLLRNLATEGLPSISLPSDDYKHSSY
jgi:hypothetical protein